MSHDQLEPGTEIVPPGPSQAAESRMLGHLDSAGRRKLGLPPEWSAFRWQGIGQDNLLTFGVQATNRAGEKRWRKPYREIVVTAQELADERRTYEAVTGHCAKCFGKGQTPASVHATKGTTWRPCGVCDGTGRAGGTP